MKNKLRILIVDDEKDLCEMLVSALDFFGYESVSAENGAVAWQLLNSEPLPDLVITDINMPVMNGRELLKRINAKYPNLPVIVVTAFGAIRSAEELHVAGADDYIEKPFSLDKLNASIKRILS